VVLTTSFLRVLRRGLRLRIVGVAAILLMAPASPSAASPTPATWSYTGSMSVPRADPQMVMLDNGDALIAGGLNPSFGSYRSVELFDPATGMWSATGSMKVQRASFVLQRLLNGDILAAGGCHSAGNCATLTATAELYDPRTGTWTRTGSMPSPREGASSLLFRSGPLAGDVLVAGGCCRGNFPFASALLYDPKTGHWSTTGSMHVARLGSAITRLRSGKVLVSGGIGQAGNVLATAELYDPASGRWRLTGSMSTGRSSQQQQRLRNGQVLAFGGFPGLASAELYNPATGRWTETGSMTDARWDFSSALLHNGAVLAAGGIGNGSDNLATAELYYPRTGLWRMTASMNLGRESAGSLLLPDGQFILAGGFAFNPTPTAELYTP
jgi:hypothetical protein